MLLFLPFIPQFAELVSRTSDELPRQIANAHTIFNLTVSAVLFPFVPQLAWLSGRMVPVRAEEAEHKLTAYIEDVQHSVPAVAINEAARELVRLGHVTAEMVENSCEALIDKNMALAQRVMVQEDQFVDPVYKEVIDFVNKLINADLSIIQQKRCFQLKNLLTDIERVADLAEDIAQSAVERIDNEVLFSTQAIDDLQILAGHVHQTYLLALQAFQDSDSELAHQVCQQESEFDQLYWKVRQEHIERLAAGVCQPEADVIFTETLRSLERISDHADNFGVSVVRNAREKLVLAN